MNRFARAMHESQAYTNSHFAETVDLVASYSGVTPDVVAHSLRNVDPEYSETKNIQPAIDMFAKYGLAKQRHFQRLISSAAQR